MYAGCRVSCGPIYALSGSTATHNGDAVDLIGDGGMISTAFYKTGQLLHNIYGIRRKAQRPGQAPQWDIAGYIVKIITYIN